MSRRLKDIILTADHQLTPQAASPSLVYANIEERRRRSMAQYNKRVSQPLKEFSKGKRCSLNPGLQISTNLRYMVKLLEVLHQGLALLTPQWDQFGGIARRLERQRLNQRTNMREQMTTWKLYPCLKMSIHSDQPVESAPEREQGPISTLRRLLRQRRPHPRFRDFVMD